MLRISMLVVALLMLVAPALQAADSDSHALIRFWMLTEEDQEIFRENQAHWDVATGRAGRFADIVIPSDEIGEWLNKGSRVELLQENMEAEYAAKNGNRDNFGDYHTFSEGVTWLDEMSAEYPEVVSAKWSLGWSYEGRNIWCVRVSDNPEVDEPGEPEVLFDSLHHAREVMSQEMVLMLIEYLAIQYRAGDPEIVSLLDENAVYMVPWVNPDGYVYNEETNPNGGGMWRKNRNPNGDGTIGVDLNRNYPYEWGCDYGSSGDPGDDTYRGPTPGSEPETQAMMQFINSHDFVVSQSFHTYSNLTLYPWGYTNNDTEDGAIFAEMGAAMCQYNGYTAGQPGEVLYEVCGGSFDWHYGQQDEHNKIFAFSNEIGATGFWPSDAERQGLFDDNLWPALYLIQMASELRGPSFELAKIPFLPPYSDPQPLVCTVEGFDNAAIHPASVLAHWRLDGGPWTTLPLLATGNANEYSGTLPSIPGNGVTVDYYVEATDEFGYAGTAPRSAPDALYTFEIAEAFDHPMEQDRGWTVGAADDDASAGIWERVDPVGSTYNGSPVQPGEDHSADGTMCWVTGQQVAGESAGSNDVDGGKTTLFSPVYDLHGGLNVSVGFWRWYSNDTGNNPSEDWWDVDISNDGGQTWTSVEHTQASDASWTQQQFMLDQYFASPGLVQLRFVASDYGSGGSLLEAAIDDVLIVGDFGGATSTPDGVIPESLAVNLNAAPNPFNPLTNIQFNLPRAGSVQVGVFNVQGRLLRTLVRETLPAGDHEVSWNGRDALGRPVPSGVYFVRLLTPDGQQLNRKILLAK